MNGSRIAIGILSQMASNNYRTGVCYALLRDYTRCNDNDLRNILQDCDYAFDSIINPVVGDSLDEILSYANKFTEFTHLAVFSSGSHLLDPQAVRTAIHSLCEEDWLVAGHVVCDEGQAFPSLRPELIILNTDLWRNIGMPAIGEADTGTHLLPRWQKNMRDQSDEVDTIDPVGKDLLEITNPGFGWNIVAQSLKHYRSVRNLTKDVSDYLVNINTDDTESLIAEVQQIRQGRAASISNLKRRSHLKYVEDVDNVRRGTDSAATFVFNTGHTIVDRNFCPDVAAHALWNTASGFKSFGEWCSRGADTNCQINTFDYNSRSLRLWNHIHYTWDGVDLYDHLKITYPFGSDDSYTWGNIFDHETPRDAAYRQENEIREFVGGTAEMKRLWRAFQRLEHRYHEIDLVENPEKFARLVDPNQLHMIWMNNIFYYSRSIRYYGVKNLHSRLLLLASELHRIAPTSKMHGQGPCGHFEDTPAAVMQQLQENHSPAFQFSQVDDQDDIKPHAGHPSWQNSNNFHGNSR